MAVSKSKCHTLGCAAKGRHVSQRESGIHSSMKLFTNVLEVQVST